MSLSKILLSGLIIIGLGIGAYFYFQPSAKAQQTDLITQVKRGPFKIKVTATGELNAKRSVKIRAPQGMRPAGIYETTLANLVAEGTLVNEGEYVASLDRTELASKMSNVQTEIEKIQTQLEQAKIDTAIELRGLRDEIINKEFSKKEMLLKVEQSQYEPQSVIQQSKLDMERTERDYQQLLKKYTLKQQQSIAKIQEINALMRQNTQQLKKLSDLSDQFTINAPKSGMVIYARNWNGKKEPGSRVTAWDPVVAELPDLTDMISKSYVNEVDISRVKVGQEVKIKVDAFPENEYSGQVIKVANIGEQLRGYDAKVFEVVIQVAEADSILRPAMTTSNEILTDTFLNALAIPLEALQNDSLSYIFKEQNGKIVKQEVVTGLSNDDEIMVDHGLAEGDRIYLNVPAKADELEFIPLDEAIKAEILRKQEEALKKRQAQALERQKKVGNVSLPSGSSGGGGTIVIID